MTKQTDLEDRMWSRGFDRRQRNINNNLSLNIQIQRRLNDGSNNRIYGSWFLF